MAQRPTINSPRGRVSFPSLHQAREFDGKKNYEVSLLFPPGTDLSKMEAEINAAAAEAFPSGVPANFHNPLRPAESKTCYAGSFNGWVVASFKSKNAPDCRGNYKGPDGKLVKIDPSDLNVVYPGCWGRVSFHVYVYKNVKGKNGAYLTLHNFQKLADDERIAGSTADGEFDEEPGECFTGDPVPGAEFLNG